MVFPGDEETLANDFLPSRVFISELFPTFDLPESATCGRASLGNCEGAPTVIDILAMLVLIFILHLLLSYKSVSQNVIRGFAGDEIKMCASFRINLVEVAKVICGNQYGFYTRAISR